VTDLGSLDDRTLGLRLASLADLATPVHPGHIRAYHDTVVLEAARRLIGQLSDGDLAGKLDRLRAAPDDFSPERRAHLLAEAARRIDPRSRPHPLPTS